MKSGVASTASDKGHNLEAVPIFDAHVGTLIPANDPAVSLDRHPVGGELEVDKQLIDRETLRALGRDPVHGDREAGQGRQRAGEAAAREAR